MTPRKTPTDRDDDTAAAEPPTAEAATATSTDAETPTESCEQLQQLHGTVDADLDGSRLDRAATVLFPPWSRGQVQRWIKAQVLTLDGEPTVRHRIVRAGMTLQLRPEPQYTGEQPPLAVPMPLDIIYRDEHLLVLNKPANRVVHPAKGHREDTLVNGLVALDETQAQLPRCGLVHRLDKDTTGLLVVARTEQAWRMLSKQLRDRSMSRNYLALVRGVPTAGDSISAPMGRHPRNRMRMAVRDAGRAALTHFKVRTKYRAHAELSVSLGTGRTHQIRVHMAHCGWPVIGDPYYGNGSDPVRGMSVELLSAIHGFHRQALHAYELGLSHPLSGEPMRWRVEPPADYLALRAALEADAERPID